MFPVSLCAPCGEGFVFDLRVQRDLRLTFPVYSVLPVVKVSFLICVLCEDLRLNMSRVHFLCLTCGNCGAEFSLSPQPQPCMSRRTASDQGFNENRSASSAKICGSTCTKIMELTASARASRFCLTLSNNSASNDHKTYFPSPKGESSEETVRRMEHLSHTFLDQGETAHATFRVRRRTRPRTLWPGG
jgi:hypothetical protein